MFGRRAPALRPELAAIPKPCARPESPAVSREPPRVHERPLGDVAPVHHGIAEPLVALVDPSREVVDGAGLCEDLLADLVKRLQQGSVEAQDSDSPCGP